jgi:chitin disaccharide deacetylase
MVRQPAAAAAATYWRAHPALSLGLHVDLGEWIYQDGAWRARYEVAPADDRAAVEAEVRGQLAAFRRLTASDPSHLDSHQHAHRTEPARTALLAVAEELTVPLRHFTPGLSYCGQFYGQTGRGEPWPAGIAVERLLEIVADLPAGATELACHPGYGDDLDSTYRHERAQELSALCDRRVRAALRSRGIALISFRELSAHDWSS